MADETRITQVSEQRKFGTLLNIIYYENEKKGTVVCKIVADRGWDNNGAFARTYNNAFDSDNEFDCINGIGVAHCSPADIFDSSKGKQIAYDRAMLQILRKVNDNLNERARFIYEEERAITQCKAKFMNEYDAVKRRLAKKVES